MTKSEPTFGQDHEILQLQSHYDQKLLHSFVIDVDKLV